MVSLIHRGGHCGRQGPARLGPSLQSTNRVVMWALWPSWGCSYNITLITDYFYIMLTPQFPVPAVVVQFRQEEYLVRFSTRRFNWKCILAEHHPYVRGWSMDSPMQVWDRHSDIKSCISCLYLHAIHLGLRLTRSVGAHMTHCLVFDPPNWYWENNLFETIETESRYHDVTACDHDPCGRVNTGGCCTVHVGRQDSHWEPTVSANDLGVSLRIQREGCSPQVGCSH